MRIYYVGKTNASLFNPKFLKIQKLLFCTTLMLQSTFPRNIKVSYQKVFSKYNLFAFSTKFLEKCFVQQNDDECLFTLQGWFQQIIKKLIFFIYPIFVHESMASLYLTLSEFCINPRFLFNFQSSFQQIVDDEFLLSLTKSAQDFFRIS